MINFLKKQKNILKLKQSGFAMLFSVLLVSLILTIALSISNITLKQTILSSLAKDSQVAFYQADAGIECGLYQDSLGLFPIGSAPIEKFYCGQDYMALGSDSYQDHYVFYTSNNNGNEPCYSILVDKTDSNITKIQSRGYNRCSTSPRQVERALEVTY